MILPRIKLWFLPDDRDKPKCVVIDRFKSAGFHDDIVIEKGFVHDGSTQFIFLWGMVQVGLGSYGEHSEAAAVHDWIYVHDGRLPDGRKYSRKQADKLFYKMLIDYGVREDRAKKAYHTVRALGWIPWVKGNGKPQIIDVEQWKN